MAAWIQTATGGTASSGAGAFAGSVVAGNTIIVCVGQWSTNQGIPTVTDNLGNTYTRIIPTGTPAGDEDLRASIFSAPVTTGGSCTVTVSGSSTGYFLNPNQQWAAFEYSGALTAEGADENIGAYGDGTDPTAGPTAASTTADNLVVAIAVGANESTGSGLGFALPGFTDLRTVDGNLSPFTFGICAGGKMISSTAAQSAAWDFNPSVVPEASSYWATAIAVFKLPAGSGAQVISAGRAASRATARSASVFPGAVSAGIGRATARARGRSPAVAPGAVAVALAAAIGSAAARAPTVAPGPVVLAPSAAAGRALACAPAASPDTVSAAPGLARIHAAAAAPAVAPGPVVIAAGLLGTRAAAHSPAVAAVPADAVALYAASARSMARAPAITPGPIAVALAPARATAAARAPGIGAGGTAVAPGLARGAALARAPEVMPGPVAVALAPARAALAARAPGIGAGAAQVAPGRVRGAAMARVPLVSPGAVAIVAGVARSLAAALSPVRLPFVPDPALIARVPAPRRILLVPAAPRVLRVPAPPLIVVVRKLLMSQIPEPIRWEPKDPVDEHYRGLDWRGVLDEGEVITSVEWSIAPTGGLEKVSQEEQGSVTIIRLKGGVAGTDYSVFCKVATSQNPAIKRTAMIYVRER